ncbi:helix-turn-helix domain-containing protein [Bacillus aquiflavi]|uniref:helix-turn-helix domain-containing protein n=1 Tax=Bacillus aquiflavi TaxID=2672567 RepID=UPI001CA7E256|nr:helix-turn-helix domain-containing protein [Bacillus aquiflavi]UAC49737.1 helix-turn-helix domain-containing protein [Bacillus aquiflavi]
MNKKERLMRRIDHHLRITARNLVKFNTREETFHFLINSFKEELPCDSVFILLKEGDQLIHGALNNASSLFKQFFPLPIKNCSHDMLEKSLTYTQLEKQDCVLTLLLKQEKLKTWFTVPIIDNGMSFGVCIIGFKKEIELYMEMDSVFLEFGNSVAVAINLIKQKEAQKQKMIETGFFTPNLMVNSPIEKITESLAKKAANITQADASCLYLYKEEESCFILQHPSYQKISYPEFIKVENTYVLEHYFPWLEKPGGNHLTVPIVINLKIIGVLHVEKEEPNFFTKSDLETLELISNHIAVMIENAQLYQNERNQKQFLQKLLNYQQKLVKKTVEQESFDGISEIIGKIFTTSIIVLDRFLRPLGKYLNGMDPSTFTSLIDKMSLLPPIKKRDSYQLEVEKNTFSVWSVIDNRDVLGYLIVKIHPNQSDDFFKLGIDIALNIYSLQFLKKKLVFDAKAQVKDTFINKLLVEQIEDQETIIQYANIFQWNLFKPHRVAFLKISLKDEKKTSFFEIEAEKPLYWERLKVHLSNYAPYIQTASKGEELVLILPVDQETTTPDLFWNRLYKDIKKWMGFNETEGNVYLGIGRKTVQLVDYYHSYREAVQAMKVISSHFLDKGYALFEELGVYTLLHQLKDTQLVKIFVKKHLGPLLSYTDGKSMDLFHTLRTFLSYNGNLKETSKKLFIHRSTLQYRLEKIQTLLNVDISCSEHRLNIMIAFKLYDLYY